MLLRLLFDGVVCTAAITTAAMTPRSTPITTSTTNKHDDDTTFHFSSAPNNKFVASAKNSFASSKMRTMVVPAPTPQLLPHEPTPTPTQWPNGATGITVTLPQSSYEFAGSNGASNFYPKIGVDSSLSTTNLYFYVCLSTSDTNNPSSRSSSECLELLDDFYASDFTGNTAFNAAIGGDYQGYDDYDEYVLVGKTLYFTGESGALCYPLHFETSML